MKVWILLLAAVGAASSEGPGDTDTDALVRMRERQQGLRTLAAKVEQTKSFPQLGIEDPAERGRLYLERGEKGTNLRFEIEAPERRVLIVTDGAYLLYQPRIKQAVEGALGEHGMGEGKSVFAGLLTGSAAAAEVLERDYRVEEVARGHLRFDAREGAAVHCQSVELWIDADAAFPRKQSCREANGSVITLTLRDVEVNAPLPPKTFELDLPSDVQKIKG